MFAVLLAFVASALSNFALEPLVQRLVGRPADLSRMDNLVGNWRQLGLLLTLSWLVGAVVEEVVFRGFLIGCGVRWFGRRMAWPLVALSSAIFGFSHLYQGTAGVLLTGVVGLILSSAYVLSRRNLLLTMLAHGLIDTISVVGLFLGFK